MVPLLILAGTGFLVLNGKSQYYLEQKTKEVSKQIDNPNSYNRGDTQITSTQTRQIIQDVRLQDDSNKPLPVFRNNSDYVAWFRSYNREVRDKRNIEDVSDIDSQLSSTPNQNGVGVIKGIPGQLGTHYRPPLLPTEDYNGLNKFINTVTKQKIPQPIISVSSGLGQGCTIL